MTATISNHSILLHLVQIWANPSLNPLARIASKDLLKSEWVQREQK